MNTLKTNTSKDINGIISLKHFPVSTREWNNSIYVYNKNALNLIPVSSFSATKIIKSYFSLFNLSIEKNLRTEKLPFRLRRMSNNKIFLGNNEFKHTNNKVVINLYLFNRQDKNYNIILKKRYESWNRRKKYDSKHKYNNNVYFKIYKTHFFLRMKYLLHTLNMLSKEQEKYKYSITNNTKSLYNISIEERLNQIELYFFRYKSKIREKVLEKLQLYFFYRQLIFINKSKFDYTYLQYLKENLERLYNKNVEFNLINLKRFYLSSDVLSETIKMKLSKNRRRIFRYLNKLKNKVKIKKKNLFLFKPVLSSNLNSISLQKNIINNIKYKDVTGFRLEAKGRLTRRYTASRSVTKVKYKGNLLNIDCSHRGLSTILLKGNLESNLQYTKCKSKTRIGSFGLKGWVSGN